MVGPTEPNGRITDFQPGYVDEGVRRKFGAGNDNCPIQMRRTAELWRKKVQDGSS